MGENKFKKKKQYIVKIDKKVYHFNKKIVTGEELLLKADKTPVQCFSLYQKLEGCNFGLISLEETVDLSHPGIERFITKEPIVFHYFVDDEPETTEKKDLTANEILELAGLNAEEYYLVKINVDGSQTSYKDNPNDLIEMKCPGLKFILIYRSSTPVAGS